MEIKKIGLFSAHSFAKPGGVQNHVLGLYKEFRTRGFEVKIIAPGRAKPQGIPEDHVITIGITKYIPANQSQAEFSVSIRRSFREKIRQEKFDVIHLHNLGFGPLSYQILRRSEALHILTVHASSDGSKLIKIPAVRALIHGLYEKKFHSVIAVSPAAFKTIESFGGFHNGPTQLIPNGVDLFRFSPTARSVSPSHHLLFVGRLEKRKGLLHLLRTCVLLVSSRKNLRLTILGEGEQRKDAEDFVSSHNLSHHVSFVGNVSDNDLPRFYRSADIFCAPALVGESFGMTLLEAMACGTPVVGFANPGYSYVMSDHEKQIGTSLLVKSGDCETLAKKIELLLDDTGVYARARNFGLARAKGFAWPKVADQILHFYREVYEWRKNRQAIDTVRM